MTITPGDLGRILSDVGIIPAIALSHAEVYDGCRIQNAVTLAASRLSVPEETRCLVCNGVGGHEEGCRGTSAYDERGVLLEKSNAEAARWRGIANRLADALAGELMPQWEPARLDAIALARSVKEGLL